MQQLAHKIPRSWPTKYALRHINCIICTCLPGSSDSMCSTLCNNIIIISNFRTVVDNQLYCVLLHSQTCLVHIVLHYYIIVHIVTSAFRVQLSGAITAHATDTACVSTESMKVFVALVSSSTRAINVSEVRYINVLLAINKCQFRMLPLNSHLS